MPKRTNSQEESVWKSNIFRFQEFSKFYKLSPKNRVFARESVQDPPSILGFSNISVNLKICI